MKITITTTRILRDEDFWDWANATIKGTTLTKKDMEQLFLTGEVRRVDWYPTTSVDATYRIVERDKKH